MKKKIILSLCLAFLLLTQAACSDLTQQVNNDQSETTTEQQTQEVTTEEKTNQTKQTNAATKEDVTTKSANDEEVMDAFYDLVTEDVNLKEAALYIDENIKSVSVENATEMVTVYEKILKDNLGKYEENFFVQEIQQKFQEIFNSEIDLNNPSELGDTTLKELAEEVIEIGYKIDQGEGTFYPVINFSFFRQYEEHVNPELQEYINILSVESEKVFAKDAALLVGWDEVINRALSAEKYLKDYPDSQKKAQVETIYTRYLYIALNGLDNTPLFDFEEETMKEDAKKAYGEAVANAKDSEFISTLSEFMDLLTDCEYKLSSEVDEFRKNAVTLY